MLLEMRAKGHVARGTAAGQLGNYPAARQDFMAAREIAPRDTSVYTSLATVFLAENKPDEAASFMRTRCRLLRLISTR